MIVRRRLRGALHRRRSARARAGSRRVVERHARRRRGLPAAEGDRRARQAPAQRQERSVARVNAHGRPALRHRHAARPDRRPRSARRSPRSSTPSASSSGPRSQAFEAEFARLHRRRARDRRRQRHRRAHCSRCARSASARATRSIVPSFTFFASAEAIALPARAPVFCDVDPDDVRASPPSTARGAMTPQTKAVIAVHLFGNVAPIAEIEALGVPVIEDAAQAAGTRLADGRRPGALGTIATFSFFPSKNLGAFGDGGAITTNDDALAETASAPCASTAPRTSAPSSTSATTPGSTSSRPAILRVQLPHLDAWADGRRAAAQRLRRGGPRRARDAARGRPHGAGPPGTSTSSRSERADELLAGAQGRGHRRRAPTTACPAHLQPAMRECGADASISRAPRRRRGRTSRSR